MNFKSIFVQLKVNILIKNVTNSYMYIFESVKYFLYYKNSSYNLNSFLLF